MWPNLLKERPAVNMTQANTHKTIVTLALPMILANITTPLLGLVDTAVLGHMPDVSQLAGAAIGALILTQIYWVCGFLRMSSTGLSAQAKGRESQDESAGVLRNGLLIGGAIGLFLVVAQSWVLSVGQWLASPEPAMAASMQQYFQVRVWGAPAALANLAIIGWLVGQQRVKAVMWLQVIGNLINVVLDLLFVFGFGWGVAGVAGASVIAEYTMCILGLSLALKYLEKPLFSLLRHKISDAAVGFGNTLAVNRDMLIRNLALQLCLAFLSFQGARFGDVTAATNAVLMQFFVLIALGLDGIAYAIEAMVGEAKGKRDDDRISEVTGKGLLWSSGFAVTYALAFFLFGTGIVSLLTDQQSVRDMATSYLPFIVVLPILAHWCFLLDGVYVGLTKASTMRNSMVGSAFLVFFPLWLLYQERENQGLWIALLGFLLSRGVWLGAHFYLMKQKRALLN